jgi:general secretion pathway protein G
LVTLVVLSILAMAALPYAQVSVTRYKELELRRALRDIRTALDLFHEDWRTGRIAAADPAVSEYGYPRSLEALVEGIELTTAEKEIRRYLRRIPREPFADQTQEPMEQWTIRSYTDDLESSSSDGRDVYDVRTSTDKVAIDGSKYSDW